MPYFDSHAYQLGGVFEWSSVMEGFVLASFYIGYTLSHLPAGVVADCYGAKWIMCAAIFVSSLTNVLTPLAIHHGDVFALTVLRIIMGAAQGPVYPAISALLSDWVPREERGTMGAFCFSGVTMGTIFATYSADHLVYEIHWVEAFLIFGCFGFICFLLFVSILVRFYRFFPTYVYSLKVLASKSIFISVHQFVLFFFYINRAAGIGKLISFYHISELLRVLVILLS